MKTKTVELKEFYDKDIDILNLYWGGTKGVEHSREIKVNLLLDFDKNDNVVGIEIYDFAGALKESQKEIDKIFKLAKKKI